MLRLALAIAAVFFATIQSFSGEAQAQVRDLRTELRQAREQLSERERRVREYRDFYGSGTRATIRESFFDAEAARVAYERIASRVRTQLAQAERLLNEGRDREALALFDGRRAEGRRLDERGRPIPEPGWMRTYRREVGCDAGAGIQNQLACASRVWRRFEETAEYGEYAAIATAGGATGALIVGGGCVAAAVVAEPVLTGTAIAAAGIHGALLYGPSLESAPEAESTPEAQSELETERVEPQAAQVPQTSQVTPSPTADPRREAALEHNRRELRRRAREHRLVDTASQRWQELSRSGSIGAVTTSSEVRTGVIVPGDASSPAQAASAGGALGANADDSDVGTAITGPSEPESAETIIRYLRQRHPRADERFQAAAEAQAQVDAERLMTQEEQRRRQAELDAPITRPRTREQLIAEARRQLRRSLPHGNLPPDFDWVAFVLESEASERRMPQEQYEQLVRRWRITRMRLNELRSAASQARGQEREALLQATRVLVQEYLNRYCRDVASVTGALTFEASSSCPGTNCQGQTHMLIAALSQFAMPVGEFLGIQLFTDHVQAVTYSQSPRRVWEPLTNTQQGQVRAPVYRPAMLFVAYLEQRNARGDVDAEQLLALRADRGPPGLASDVPFPLLSGDMQGVDQAFGAPEVRRPDTSMRISDGRGGARAPRISGPQFESAIQEQAVAWPAPHANAGSYSEGREIPERAVIPSPPSSVQVVQQASEQERPTQWDRAQIGDSTPRATQETTPQCGEHCSVIGGRIVRGSPEEVRQRIHNEHARLAAIATRNLGRFRRDTTLHLGVPAFEVERFQSRVERARTDGEAEQILNEFVAETQERVRRYFRGAVERLTISGPDELFRITGEDAPALYDNARDVFVNICNYIVRESAILHVFPSSRAAVEQSGGAQGGVSTDELNRIQARCEAQFPERAAILRSESLWRDFVLEDPERTVALISRMSPVQFQIFSAIMTNGPDWTHPERDRLMQIMRLLQNRDRVRFGEPPALVAVPEAPARQDQPAQERRAFQPLRPEDVREDQLIPFTITEESFAAMRAQVEREEQASKAPAQPATDEQPGGRRVQGSDARRALRGRAGAESAGIELYLTPRRAAELVVLFQRELHRGTTGQIGHAQASLRDLYLRRMSPEDRQEFYRYLNDSVPGTVFFYEHFEAVAPLFPGEFPNPCGGAGGAVALDGARGQGISRDIAVLIFGFLGGHIREQSCAVGETCVSPRAAAARQRQQGGGSFLHALGGCFRWPEEDAIRYFERLGDRLGPPFNSQAREILNIVQSPVPSR